MSVEEYFKQYRNLELRIKYKEARIEMLKEMCKTIHSVDFSREPVQCSKTKDANFVKHLIEIDEAEKELQSDIKLYSALRKEMESIIDALSDEEKSMMQQRYFFYKSYGQIGVTVHLERSSVFKKMKRLLETIELPPDYIKI